MVDNDQFGRFDPRTEKWQLWTLRPSNLPDSASMAGAAIVHDMSIDSNGHMARDAAGKIWLTMVGTNQMGTLHPDSGEVAFYDTNRVEGLSPINHLIYSTVLSADGRHAWYSQVNGAVGCIDTATKKVEKIIPFREGSGPRRMARDNAGNLWVALFGSGQVAKIDMARARSSRPTICRIAPRRPTPSPGMNHARPSGSSMPTATRSIASIHGREPAPFIRCRGRWRTCASSRSITAAVGWSAATAIIPEGSGPSMGVLIDVGN